MLLFGPPYYLAVAIVSDPLIVITYAYYCYRLGKRSKGLAVSATPPGSAVRMMCASYTSHASARGLASGRRSSWSVHVGYPSLVSGWQVYCLVGSGLYLPLSQSLRFGSAGDRLIVYAASIVPRRYCPRSLYCLAPLLSDVASLYAIVQTPIVS
jgi:hypothetical protein